MRFRWAVFWWCFIGWWGGYDWAGGKWGARRNVRGSGSQGGSWAWVGCGFLCGRRENDTRHGTGESSWYEAHAARINGWRGAIRYQSVYPDKWRRASSRQGNAGSRWAAVGIKSINPRMRRSYRHMGNNEEHRLARATCNTIPRSLE